MEEKILIKGEFGGKIIPLLFYIFAAILFVFITILDTLFDYDGVGVAIAVGSALVLVLYGFIFSVILQKRELIVTNKRVIARGAFGYRTDIPTEKITDVSIRSFNSIGCGSPSLKIMFLFCKNKTEIFDTIISESLQRDSKYK